MILTIGMIVKNEADKLKKCLESLEPLRKAVSSELIIVDTGSDDNTVEIAKAFTDNVFFFEWCGDFSAARNESFRNAKGGWFMFIDADEWFEDCSGIIRFFNSGEYKKYNSATFIQRNYTTSDINGFFIDYDALRLTRRLPGTRFVNKIHEHFNTAGEPIKRLTSFVHHFGYADINEGDREKKRKRNEELLLKSVEENPENVSLYVQLFDCYYGYDNALAVEYCRKGIEINKKNNFNKYGEFIFLKLIAIIYANTSEFDKAVEVIDEYYLKRKKTKAVENFIVTDLEIAAIEIIVYYKLKNAEKTINSCVKYNTLFQNYKDGKYSMSEVLMSALRFVSETEYVNNNIIYIQELFETGRIDEALKIKKRFSYDYILKLSGTQYIKLLIQYEISAAVKSENSRMIEDLFAQLSENSNLLRILEGCILSAVALGSDSNGFLVKCVNNEILKYNPPVNFKDLLNLYYVISCDNSPQSFYSLAESFDVIPFYMADIIPAMIKLGFDIVPVLKKMSLTDIHLYFEKVKDKVTIFLELITYLDDYKFESACSCAVISEFLFNIIKNCSGNDMRIAALFGYYAYASEKLFGFILQSDLSDNVKTELWDIMPNDHKIAYYCINAVKAFDEADTKQCDYYMQKAVAIDTGLENATAVLGRIFGELKIYPVNIF